MSFKLNVEDLKMYPETNDFVKWCNMSEIESEYHFLLVFFLYTELRSKFFKS